MPTNMIKAFRRVSLPLVVATIFGSGLYQGSAYAALPATPCTGTGTVTCNLWAKPQPGTTLTTGVSVTVWGYTDTPSGTPALPGPVLIVNQGDLVTVNLTNNLPEPTGLLFQGQSLPPDTVGAAPGGPPKSYTFTASAPGTYLYEASLLPNAQHHVAMGLYGALVVRPSAGPSQAYGDAATSFDDEALVVLGEIDPLLNAGPAGFDMRNFAPRYFLINGKAHPSTNEIPAVAGQKILLRYVNAGIQHHSMALLGLRQTVIAYDGSLLPNFHDIVAETVAPGQTLDAIATVPASAVTGSKFALYDANLKLNNSSSAGIGGMLTFLTLAGTPPDPGPPPPPPPPLADTTGPVTSGLTLTPNPSNGSGPVALSATGNDTATGNSNVVAAEYTIDAGPAQAMTVGTPGPVAIATASVPTTSPPLATPLPDGLHTIAVRSQDAVLNWGAPANITLTVDRTGPATSSVTATPNPTNGRIGVNSNVPAVRVQALLSDTLTRVAAAEAFIDAVGATGSGTQMAASDGTFDSLSETGFADFPLATILQLSNGSHSLSVRGRNAVGIWGGTSTATLVVDKVAPVVTAGSVAATPSPTFGNFTLNAAVTDAAPSSGVAAGEWFEGTDPGVGRARPMVASGANPNWTLSAALNVQALNWAEGSHTTNVRAKDAAGNWSAVRSGTVTVIAPVYFSTTGNTNPPGVAGTADDADIYFWNGTAFSRAVDVTAIPNPVPAGANVDGLQRVDNTHFYLSFTGDTTLPGLGTVQDEDIVFYNAGTWSVLFDGTAAGLTNANATIANNLDIDAFAITGSNRYFSTAGNSNPPGVGGTADDADIYLWNGTAFSRVVDATTIGVPGGANVDGLKFVDSTHFYLSFAGDTTLPGLGAVQDEDIVYYNAGTWSVYFNGTAAPKSLTSANLDIDAFSIP